MSVFFNKILTLEVVNPEFTNDVEEAPEPLSDDERKSAITNFANSCGDKIKNIKFYNKNTNKKHDRIIADIPDGIDKKKKDLISYINNKQKDFVYVIKGKYLIANPKKKKVKENVIQSLINNDIFDYNLEKYELSLDEIKESSSILYNQYIKSNIDTEYITGYSPDNYYIARFKIPKYTSTIEEFKVSLNNLNTKYKYSTNYDFRNNIVEFYAQKKDNYIVTESYYKSEYISIDSHIIDSYIRNCPILKHIVDHGYPSHIALEMLVLATIENPYIVNYIYPINESIDTEYDELDNRAFFTFLDIYENYGLDSNKIGYLVNDNYNYIAESVIDSAKKTVKRNVDKVVTHIKSGRLSPVIAKLKDGLEELTGLSERKKEEMVVSGSMFIKLRRIFFKTLVFYKSVPLLWAVLPGGFMGFAMKIVATVAGLGKIKSEITGKDDDSVKRRCISELETELKMTREKINDAKHDGDKKAKYQLMRLESKIEQEIQRIKFGDPINKGKGIVINSYDPNSNNKLKILYENLEITQKHLLPLDVSKFKSRNSRLLCINTAMASRVLSITAPTAMVIGGLAAIGGAAVILPSLLGLIGFTAYVSSHDITAVDFIPITKDIKFTNELNGVPVIAINDGIVVEAVGDRGSMRYRDFVLIDHGGFYALYGFIDGKTIKVKKGDKVKRGSVIAKIGKTSNLLYKDKPLLHFEMTYTNLMNKNNLFDPLIEIPKSRTGFVDYKYTEIGYNNAVGVHSQYKDFKRFEEVYKTPLTMNRSGELSGSCFLT